MFWKQARAKYGHLTKEDKDISRYLKLTSNFQQDNYQGIVGFIQDLGHLWVARHTSKGPVLEIGFGTGRHGLFFNGDINEYFVSEYSAQNSSRDLWQAYRDRSTICDALNLSFPDNSFEIVISIYNLEHITNLAQVFSEIHRVLIPGGRLLVALPCEGGLFWNVGREVTTRRYFQKQYGLNYDKIIAYEHVWDLKGILTELKICGLFNLHQQTFYPFLVPTYHLNLIACLECCVIKST